MYQDLLIVPANPHPQGEMRKLKLDLDELQVESFQASPLFGRGGTVNGQGTTIQPGHPIHPPTEVCEPGGGGGVTVGTCIGPTYCCQPTWQATCMATCPDTCGGITCLDDWCSLIC
jgi:hypothetical protein